MAARRIETQCCIVGGGPAGIMLGCLLARAGIDVVVLEKWPDFFRDFRGDTIHPSTMTVLDELGLLDEFLSLPHQKTYRIGARVGGEHVIVADFSGLKTETPFIAFVPQWDFLALVSRHARRYPGCHLMMGAEATDLLERGGRVVGVRASANRGNVEIGADLVVGADGRHSTIRARAGLAVRDLGAPMDVLWFRVPRLPSDPQQSLGTIGRGHLMVMIDRGDYWQCGFVIGKGRFEQIKAEGIARFREQVAGLAPFLTGRLEEIHSWDDVKSLLVAVDRLEQWAREGVLCIGDAAHTMSPIGGVGINLAVQDAVAAANILVLAFARGGPRLVDLRAVQRRRMLPTRATQAVQLFIQKRFIEHILGGEQQPQVPLVLRLLQRVPALQRIPARLIGIGVRPEHVAM